MSVYNVDGTTSSFTVNFNYSELKAGQMKVNFNYPDSKFIVPNNLSIKTEAEARGSLEQISTAIDKVSAERARLGAYQNRLEHSQNHVLNYSENLTASESRIRDADYAKEITETTKSQIFIQAGQAMLAQANSLPESILQLLK